MAGAWGAIGQVASEIGGKLFDASVIRSEAAKQRQWALDASSTAYQRAAIDMKKAGLNPILAAGSPASTPSGSAGTSPIGGRIDILGAINSAKQLQITNEQLKQEKLKTIEREIDTQYKVGGRHEYESNPNVRKSADAARVAKEVGVRPELLFFPQMIRNAGMNAAGALMKLIGKGNDAEMKWHTKNRYYRRRREMAEEGSIKEDENGYITINGQKVKFIKRRKNE